MDFVGCVEQTLLRSKVVLRHKIQTGGCDDIRWDSNQAANYTPNGLSGVEKDKAQPVSQPRVV